MDDAQGVLKRCGGEVADKEKSEIRIRLLAQQAREV